MNDQLVNLTVGYKKITKIFVQKKNSAAELAIAFMSLKVLS